MSRKWFPVPYQGYNILTVISGCNKLVSYSVFFFFVGVFCYFYLVCFLNRECQVLTKLDDTGVFFIHVVGYNNARMLTRVGGN